LTLYVCYDASAALQAEKMTVDGALAAQLKDIVGRQEASIDRSQAVVMRLQADNSVLLARVHELEASLAGKSQLLSADVV
jgi:BMFP domain-containing protein YqiC